MSLRVIVGLSGGVDSAVTALLLRRLPLRWTSRALLVGGLLAVAVGQLAQTGLDPGSSLLRLVPGLLVTGVAFGVLNATVGREAVASVPADRTAMGSGANNTARYVGSAIGVTVVAVVATRPGLAPGPVGLLEGWHTAVLVAAASSLLGAAAVAACRPARGEGGAATGDRADSGHGQRDAQPDAGTSEGAVPGGPGVGGRDPQGRR